MEVPVLKTGKPRPTSRPGRHHTALIGVTHDDRAVYDYDLMVEWLMEEEGFTEEEARKWIDYNTLRALPYMGSDGPVILNRFLIDD